MQSKKLQRFKNACSAHTGADTHGDHAVFLFAAFHAVNNGRGTNSTGSTEWVP